MAFSNLVRVESSASGSSAAPVLYGSPSAGRKIRILVIMEDEYWPWFFGPDELTELKRYTDLPHSRLRGADLAHASTSFDEVEAIVSTWGMPALTPDLLRRFPRLRVVFYAAGTVRSIVTDEVWRRGIRITTAALANAKPVAEFTVAAIVFSLKRVWERARLLRERQQYPRHEPPIPGCYGTTVGLVALGKIGREVARRLQSMDITVVGFDPYVDPAEAAELGVRLCSIEEVFSIADVVSCHLPLHPGTADRIDGALLRRMKRNSTFINTARGAVVNERDLVAILRERPDLYAVLDTIVSEPPSADDPLLHLPNAIVTPHIAGSMCLECRRMGRMMLDELRHYVAGEPLLGEVHQAEIGFLA